MLRKAITNYPDAYKNACGYFRSSLLIDFSRGWNVQKHQIWNLPCCRMRHVLGRNT